MLAEILYKPQKFLTLADTRLGKVISALNIPLVSSLCTGASLFLITFERIFPDSLIKDISYIPFILLLVGILFAEKKKIILDKSALWYFGFLLVAAISAAIATIYGLNSKMLILGWFVFVPLIAAYLLGHTQKSDYVLTIITAVAVPSAMVGAYQFLSKQVTPQAWFSSFDPVLNTRAFGTFDNPNVFGMFMCLAILASVGLYFINKNKLWLLPIILYGFVIFASFSRTAWFALILIGVMFVISYNYKYLVFSPFLLLSLFVTKIRERLYTLLKPEYWLDYSLDGRTWAINNGLYIWRQYPILGTGPGSYGGRLANSYASPAYHLGLQQGYVALYFTDNQYIQLLVQTGMLGLFAFLGFFISYVWSLVSGFFAGKRLYLIGLGVAVSFLIFCLFSNALEFGALTIPAGLMMGSVLNED